MPRPVAALAWFAAALGLYGLSAAPGPLWGDSAKLAIYALHGYWPSANPGDHPGLTLLAQGWLAGTAWLDPVRALHLLSAASGAAAVALLFLFVARAIDDATAHTSAAVLLAMHPLWWSAAVTESYAPAACAVLVVALAASREAGTWRSLAAGLAAGLGLAIHGFTVFLTVPLLLALPWRRTPVALAGAIVGSAPVWIAFLAHPADPLTGHQAGSTATWGWHAAVFLDPGRFVTGLVGALALLLFALGPIGLVALAGALRARTNVHPRPLAGLVATALLVVVLALYSPFRLHLMVLFPLLGLLLLAPPRLSARLRAGHVALQAGLYLLAPLVATAVGLGSLHARQLPDRDNARYFLSPVKRTETGPQRYAHRLLDACPPHAVVLADFNPGAVLRLVQEREALRPDVVVIPTAIDEALATRSPAATIATHLDRIAAQGRPAVLADGWPPYYRVAELEGLGFDLAPCGPGLLAICDSARTLENR